jgi:hypothetical protein
VNNQLHPINKGDFHSADMNYSQVRIQKWRSCEQVGKVILKIFEKKTDEQEKTEGTEFKKSNHLIPKLLKLKQLKSLSSGSYTGLKPISIYTSCWTSFVLVIVILLVLENKGKIRGRGRERERDEFRVISKKSMVSRLV